MNKKEAIQKLNDNGIYQLRKGETLADALESINNKTQRKGYEYRNSDGSLMSKNKIIAEANKEAFGKSIREPEYIGYEEDDYDVEDITGRDDYRSDMTKLGGIQPCKYCGKALRVDEGANYEILNCEDCSSYAIWCNCM